MKVSFNNIDRQYYIHRQAIRTLTDVIWSSGRVLSGKSVEGFEQKLADLCGRAYGVAVGSCTDALYFALKAIGVGKGDKVLVPKFTFRSSYNQIEKLGAKPVFLDVDRYFLLKFPKRVSKQVKAIIAVDLFGQTVDFDKVNEFAKKHNLVIIEDFAQALGAFDGERPAGSLGRISCTSFDPSKILSSLETGGMLLTDNKAVEKKVRKWRTWDYNSQMSCAMAEVLQYKFRFLPDFVDYNGKIWQFYWQGLEDVVEVPMIRPGCRPNWSRFVIRCKNRDKLKEFLKEEGIGTKIQYDDKDVLSLPLYPELLGDEADFVVKKIREFYERR